MSVASRSLSVLLVATLLAVPSTHAQDEDSVEERTELRDDRVTSWLPRDLEPLHYRVRIQPILQDGNFSAPAELEFTFRARAATDRVVVNVRDLLIDKASVIVEQEGPAGSWSPLTQLRHEQDPVLETYSVVLESALRPSLSNRTRRPPRPGGHALRATRYRLKMKYIAPVGDNLKGLYRVSYRDENNNKRWMAMTQLHPTNARSMFPCMDEPQYKARFTLSVARLNNYTSVANMPVRSTEPMAGSDAWVWDHFETSVPMSSYLIALAVFDFAKLESPVESPSDTKVRVWAKHADIARGEYAARIAPAVLRFFSRTFNISFPLPKQDMVAAPELIFGAMENWGLIFFRERVLLVDDSDKGSRHSVASTVAHELAHQWFGNLVTMRWWNDVWLNEGFATYMSQLGLSHVEPQWRSEGVFVLDNMQRVMQSDALPSSHPVSREVFHVSDIDHIFDDISYKKGSSVVRMMSEFLGADAFQRGLNAYLREHAYGNAAQDDLWAALTDAAASALPAGQSVKSIMDSWTLRTGFPVVTVTRDYADGTVRVHQERFLVTTNATGAGGTAKPHGAGAECCWGVPLWVKSAQPSSNGSKKEDLHWLLGAGMVLEGLPASGWILVNGARAGYYRVNYDAANWMRLVDDLDALTDLERAGLVDDALALAGAGRLQYDMPLALLRRLPRDAPALAWVAALPWLSKLSHLLHGVGGTSSAFSQWTRALAADLLKAAEGVRHSTDPVDHAFVTRVQSWACGMAVPGCLGAAHIRSQDEDICTAVKSEDEWNTVVQNLSRENLLKLAECIQAPLATESILELAFSGNTDEQLMTSLLKKLAANPHSYNTVIEFLKDQWVNIQNSFGTALNSEIVKATSPYVKNEYHMTQMKRMISSLNQNSLLQNVEEGYHNMWWLQNLSDKMPKSVERLQ